jgi:hypothetical protein
LAQTAQFKEIVRHTRAVLNRNESIKVFLLLSIQKKKNLAFVQRLTDPRRRNKNTTPAETASNEAAPGSGKINVGSANNENGGSPPGVPIARKARNSVVASAVK